MAVSSNSVFVGGVGVGAELKIVLMTAVESRDDGICHQIQREE